LFPPGFVALSGTFSFCGDGFSRFCGVFRDIFLLMRNTSTFGRQNVDEMLVARKISMFEQQNVDEMFVVRKISMFERHNVDEMFVQGMFVPDVRRFPGHFVFP
jgi:hypothetical protein